MTLRVAITLEQCWHKVPGGTATSMLELATALKDTPGVDVLGVAARHRSLPPPPFRPPVPTRLLPLPRRMMYESWHRIAWPPVQRATGEIDLIHATTMAIPPKSAPLVVTVHDLIFLRDPTHFTRHGVRFFQRGLELTRKNADIVLVPSRATFDDCVDAGIDATRLRVVPHGVKVPAVTEAQVRDFAGRHRLPSRYIMWCGTLEPRKNVPSLLAAFAIARRKEPDLGLVLVGPAGWGDVNVPETDGVTLLGFLSNGQLHAAYKGAQAFCYPSLREGFGLPVLEAMAHGVPAITSAGSAMAEFASGAGLLVDPLDVDGLAAAMVAASGDRHDELAAAASARAARYTWASAAERTVAAYREAVGR